jgi:hypothetical protein
MSEATEQRGMDRPVAIKLDREAIIMALQNARNLEMKGRKGIGILSMDYDTAWAAIEWTVSSVLGDRNRNLHAIEGAKRRNHFIGLAKNLKFTREALQAALDTPELIDPFMWAWDRAENGDDAGSGMVDWEHVERQLRKSLGHVAMLEKWAALAQQEAATAVVNHRPARPKPLSRLIGELARIYKKHTGRDPGESWDAIKEVGTGPFVRFVCAVIAGTVLQKDETAVADAISEMKRDPESEWCRVYEPQRDPTEVFADFLMGEN